MAVERETQEQVLQRLKNLPQYKSLPKEALDEIAKFKASESIVGLDMTGRLVDKKELYQAKELLKKYVSDYTIETISDMNILKDIVYLEILVRRFQIKLNEFHKTDGAVPISVVEMIQALLDQIVKLKGTLGITRKGPTKGGFDALQALTKKFKLWLSENQGSRTLVCPHCGKMVMLKIRTEAWEAQKHPFFKDRVLYNKHLMKLYHAGTITKKDVAAVLEASPDYVDWLVEKIEKSQGGADGKNTERVEEAGGKSGS